MHTEFLVGKSVFSNLTKFYSRRLSKRVSQLAFYVILKLTWQGMHSFFLTWTQLHQSEASLIPRATGGCVLVSVTHNDNVIKNDKI